MSGTSCFGHSLLALDGSGRPLTPILGWRDTRSADAADWLTRPGRHGAVQARTGCQIHTSYWPAKLAWLAQDRAGRCSARRTASSRSATTSTRNCSGELRHGHLDRLCHRPRRSDHADLGRGAARRARPRRRASARISDEPIDGWYPALLDGACSNLGAGCVTRERAALMVGTSGAVRMVYETATPEPRAASSCTGSTRRASWRADRSPTAGISTPGWSRR